MLRAVCEKLQSEVQVGQPLRPPCAPFARPPFPCLCPERSALSARSWCTWPQRERRNSVHEGGTLSVPQL